VVNLQETKVDPMELPQDTLRPQGYKSVWNWSGERKGYSGTACYHRGEIVPLEVSFGLPDRRYGGEGRLIRLEFEEIHLLNVYFPNGQKNQERLDFKLGYYDAFLDYAHQLRESKPVVVCGDFNTAHTEKDIARPRQNANRSGFLPVEREWMDRFTEQGYLDTFRLFVDEGGHYSWWSLRSGARDRDVGWRLDYFFVSEELRGSVKRAWIEKEVLGSDHCPVGLELDLGSG
jgi:exodeoxyribonuclease-3